MIGLLRTDFASDWNSHVRTRSKILQPDCDICIKSLPFYRKLLDKFQDPGNVTLVLITPSGPEVAREFFKNEGLSFTTALQGKRGVLGVPVESDSYSGGFAWDGVRSVDRAVVSATGN
jgi:hypothetical protein